VEEVLTVRVLVTGAGGFVGRHLAVSLARNGHDVTALLRRMQPSALDQQAGVNIACADLGQAEIPLAGPFDALVHCAAAIPSAVPDDFELTRINIEGARHVFEHALQAGAATIIFCSSMAVYGCIDKEVVDPDTPVQDATAYGRSKLICEHLLADLSRAHPKLCAVSLRLPGVVGPGSHHNFLSDTMARLIAGQDVIVRNADAPFNNVVHIDDLADFVATLLRSLPVGHRAMTIGAKHSLPIRAVVGILEAAAGRPGAARYEGGGGSFLISNEAAKSLGYRPASVRDSVRRFAEAHVLELTHQPAARPSKGEPRLAD
jgi:nucleoside-diphosphate-sugar epimerase